MEAIIYPPYERAVIEPTDLSLRRSIDLLAGIQQHDYAELLGCGKFQESENEYLTVRLNVNVPQYPINDVRGVEVVLIEVLVSDEKLPWVYSTREDFPVVSHLNLTHFELPRSLCLYEELPEAVKLSWSGYGYIERIREWLALTAEGKLHQEDQPLEQFFISSNGNLILPLQSLSKDFSIVGTDKIEGKIYNYRSVDKKLLSNNANRPEYFLLEIEIDETVHGYVNATPNNLHDLYNLLKRFEIDLLDRLLELYQNDQNRSGKILLYLRIKQKRQTNTEVENVSQHAFAFYHPLEKVLSDIGILSDIDSGAGTKVTVDSYSSIIDPREKEKIKKEAISKSQAIPVYILMPHHPFNKGLAEMLASSAYKKKIVISHVGVGALGSPVALNLARSGFGEKYYIFDHDTLLPHNLSRHILGDLYVGYFKSKALAVEMNQILSDRNYAIGKVDKVASTMSDEFRQILISSDLIIDSSASVPVSRFINKLGRNGSKIISVFLNPNGRDLVILASGDGINITQLEMLYYAHVITKKQLHNHLLGNNRRIRYSGGCSDITSILSNEVISIHAGIASGVIKGICDDKSSLAAVWMCQDDYSVNKVKIPIHSFQKHTLNNWNLYVSEKVIDTLNEARKRQLPNETGGILIGSYDTEWNELYIVDTIVSPKDSIETPISYIRGINGVEDRLIEIEKKTLYNLTYLGEWHSHPDGASTQMSEDDKIQLNWIQEIILGKGHPGIMLIVGEKDISVYF